MSELFKQIVWFLNSLASGGSSTEVIADVIVINFPSAWIVELGNGYKAGHTGTMHDSVLIALDIVQQSIDIKH